MYLGPAPLNYVNISLYFALYATQRPLTCPTPYLIGNATKLNPNEPNFLEFLEQLITWIKLWSSL